MSNQKKTNMNNGEKNKLFLNSISEQKKDAILNSIANHYGTTAEKILIEVTDIHAELLPEYMVGHIRTLVYYDMKERNLI